MRVMSQMTDRAASHEIVRPEARVELPQGRVVGGPEKGEGRDDRSRADPGDDLEFRSVPGRRPADQQSCAKRTVAPATRNEQIVVRPVHDSAEPGDQHVVWQGQPLLKSGRRHIRPVPGHRNARHFRLRRQCLRQRGAWRRRGAAGQYQRRDSRRDELQENAHRHERQTGSYQSSLDLAMATPMPTTAAPTTAPFRKSSSSLSRLR